MKRPLQPGVFGHASFELADGVRVGRLRLDRWWDPTLDLAFGRPCDDRYNPLVVIGMNPSDADGENDDPTIGKCITFARREGANGLVMVNATPEITKDPERLGTLLMPYGCDERQWEAIDGALSESAVHVVAAWGKAPRLSSWPDRIARIKDRLILSQRDYHTRYEPLWYGWKQGAGRIRPVLDRKQDDVWEIPRPFKSEDHPTMKPIELCARAIQNSSESGDLVYEPFSGSGSTLMACEQLGRSCAAIELAPQYVDSTLRRWETFTGKKAERLK